MNHRTSLLALTFLAAALAVASGCTSTATRPPTGADYEARFRARAEYVLENQAKVDPVDVMEWANRIDLGDPHKYALGPILARLHHDPQDPRALEALRMLGKVNEAKGDRGLYHFAAYYRTRLMFQFGDKLPRDIADAQRYDVRNFFKIMTRGGTENHCFMHRTSGYLWTEVYPDLAAPNGHDREWLREWLRGQVKRLYTVGQGEYDSSTYLVFDAASWANIYDYSEDPEMRLLAKAALDWMATAIARKYFHGCTLGPESRGFAKEAVRSNTDWLAWLWWDDSARTMGDPADPQKVAKHAAVVLALSSYRPDPIIRAIARKAVDLPYEARGSKPNYWGGPPSKDHEILYFNDAYAMGTLYSPEKGVRTRGTILPQTTMFKVALRGKDNVYTFGAANGYHRHFPVEGRTPYDQYHQGRDAAINVCYVPEPEDERTRHRSILGVPLGTGEPVRDGPWWLWQVGRAYVAARPLGADAAWQDLGRDKKNPTHRWLVSPGKLGGWVIQLGQAPEYADLEAFAKAVRERTKLDLGDFKTRRVVTFTSLRGDVLKIRHTGGPGGLPRAWTNGERLEFGRWPVYASPWVNQSLDSGVLTVTDGKATLRIDCSGEWPSRERK